MTIRLGYAAPHRSLMNPRAITVPGNGAVLAYVDTDAEAEQAKRAFENVLAPRFTRDEAIAIVRNYALIDFDEPAAVDAGVRRGIRLALEALAAASVFSDCHSIGCGGPACVTAMRDLLDAAGIR
jgi:hypothetical protein